jgi:CRP/FNR family transcriptional regulator/CRP/FNR family cyclic AMP-dependent transcriptional regulator
MLRTHTILREGKDRRYPVLGSVSPLRTDDAGLETIGPLASRGHRIRVPARRFLFHKGDHATELYLLLRGHVKITTVSKLGQEMILAILGPGDVLGDVAVAGCIERTTAAATLETCDLLSLSRYDVLASLDQHPGFILKVLQNFNKRLQAATALIEDLVFLDLPARLAKKLLTLGRIFGQTTNGGLRIECRLTQQELANMVGATRESINKVLSAWKGKGLLSMTDRCLVIPKPEDLLVTVGSPPVCT